MADNVGKGDSATTSSVRCPRRHYFAHRRRKIKRGRDPRKDIDLISSLPDEILQVILSFISTKLAITTSVLSRRWRHIWCNTPSLSFSDNCNLDPSSVDKILSRYTARKMMSFKLCIRSLDYHYLCSWVKFAMYRNVENLWLEHRLCDMPDFFYNNSSVKQLYVKSKHACINPRCSVSWTSLKILTLYACNLKDKSFAKIISGSPLLETLRLYHCDELHHLDLSKSPRLKTLEIDSKDWLKGTRIDAPHLQYLRLRLTNSMFPYTLVDVSSLTEAEIDTDASSDPIKIVDHCLQTLEKLQNVEKLTFGERFLEILSRAELLGYPSPKLKAKVLTLKTTISQYVISGIVRLLQHSPELKKLTLRTMDCDAIQGYADNYLDSYTWIPYRCSESLVFGDIKSRDVETKHVALFMELVLKTTKTLEKMVVRLGPYRSERGIKELRQKVPMLSHDKDVSIVLIATKRWIRESSKW
ncbi:PREDICTED: putative F-box protein At1g49610 [Camelina sativa]|uniref:F-box protein At1g49610 n=1 Tax=Camelina sativa TaxID=90675 RepID=A0ABM0ZAW8_CAMSA|nr:PREDICTED: putative F-box protein At1g49610 [Camelina sativa]